LHPWHYCLPECGFIGSNNSLGWAEKAVLVADGVGVLLVPRQRALEAARIAPQIHVGDEKSRAKRHERLGIPL
jgi:hypothetical protein